MRDKSRQSLRLQQFNYSSHRGYFLTCCTKWRDYLFGNVVESELRLNAAGLMVDGIWRECAERFADVCFDCHIVMPNHFHALVWVRRDALFDDPVAAAPVAAAQHENERRLFRRGEQDEVVIRLMHDFKGRTTNEYIKGVKRGEFEPFNVAVWQRTYYDHVIRKSDSVQRIRDYIQTNPLRWNDDRFRTKAPEPDGAESL